ncbi:2Fe-2S iron-sulfur cluster-binding protein [Novosphingobium sp. JCM 18896]|uniref:2Fe-2S iron-sulfur cluster-binding protein n=1 Tax=Novosphingobium sp. JCM 18896 TaxID=2989731 RepID=UPI002222A649|nr:2Fe-2S iron-sulfur cluster-binding protein [Novosphingobium sp. JCM 18896]MCW1431917.1 FAD-binding oxidoreductase [Novosphingobium sp. JCM 18896]
MLNTVGLRRLGLCAALALGLSTIASAQEGEDHAAHHGGAAVPMVGGDSMAPPAAASGSGMDAMMGEMMGEAGEHGRRTGPFMSQLLVPALGADDRSRIARQARERVEQGLALIGEASAAARSADPGTRAKAAWRMREGADLFRSGSAALEAVDGERPPEHTAVSWFREQMGLGPLPHELPARWLGVSPSHFMLMFVLALVSATLLALQLARLRRIRKIVGAAAPAQPHGAASAVPAPVSPRVAPASATSLDALTPSNSAPAAGASLRKPKSWSGQLRVVQIVRETPTVQTFRLADPAADRLPFDFLPGQFLQVEVEPEGGRAARRSYTIASSPTQRAHVELTVKREEQGVVSRHLHDHVSVGDHLKITGPFGAFTFTGTDAESIVLIAGGVGITPMMSVLRYLTDTAWPGEIFFLYGARSTEEFVFRDELERLERRFANLHVLAAMQRAPGTVWLGPEGPITRQMLVEAVPDIARRRIHLCGPPGMMAAMRKELAELGVPEVQLHTEAFGPASLPAEPETLEVKAPTAPFEGTPAAAAVAATTITFSVAGVSAALPADQTVLEAAEGAGVEIPYACRSGECGVCVTRLISGEVTMEVETGLAPEDKTKGYVLACQAKSTGQPLVVEA